MDKVTGVTIIINVIAALIGLSYPLFLQIIQGLDAKYHSVNIVNRFKKTVVYNAYNVLLVATFLWLVYIPFASEPPEAWRDSFFWNNSAHIIGILLLLVTVVLLICLSYKIWRYYNPHQLYEIVASKPEKIYNNPEKYKPFLDILKYSMLSGDKDLYLKCNTTFGECVGLSLKSMKGKEVVYPLNIYTTIEEAVQICGFEKTLYPSLRHPELFIAALYDTFGETRLSEQTYLRVWWGVKTLTDTKEKDNVINYWTFADQYATYKLFYRSRELDENGRPNEEAQQDFFHFQEFHHLFGSYLLYKEEYATLDTIYDFSTSSDDRKHLIPTSINDIVEHIIFVFNAIHAPFYLEIHYPFNTGRGAHENDFILGCLLKYYCYSLIKVNYDFRHQHWQYNPTDFKWDNVNSEDLLKVIDLLIFQMDKAIPQFTDIFDDKPVYEIIGFLTTLREDCVNKQSEEASRNVISEEKENRLIELISNELANAFSEFPKDNNPESKYTAVPIEISVRVPKPLLYEKSKFSLESSAEAFATLFNYGLKEEYGKIFRRQHTSEDYYVNLFELNEAFEKLGSLDGYARIACGINGKDAQLNIPPVFSGNEAAIIILPDKQLPRLKDPQEFKLENSQYTEIPNWDKEILLEASTKVEMSIPKLSYVKLVIINSDLDGRQSTLSSIRPLSEILPIA